MQGWLASFWAKARDKPDIAAVIAHFVGRFWPEIQTATFLVISVSMLAAGLSITIFELQRGHESLVDLPERDFVCYPFSSLFRKSILTETV